MNEDLDFSEFGEQCLKLWEEGTLVPKLEAYDDGGHNPTISWGCTEGVYFGMKITADQAELMFRNELKKHIALVRNYITRPLQQQEFDTCVSFFYNEGVQQGFIKAVNGKTYKDDVPAALMKYVYARKYKGGPLVRWSGLVDRRANEVRLWQGTYHDVRMTAPNTYAVANNNDIPYAKVPPEPPSRKAVATLASLGGAGALTVAQNDPIGTAEQLISTGQRVQNVAEQSGGLLQWASAAVGLEMLAAVAACGGIYWFFGHWLPGKFGSAA